MRYYLDTNILVFLITGQKDEIDPDVKEHIFDYANRMMTSSVCVHELMHLYQIGKLPFKKGAHPPLPPDVLSWLEDIGLRWSVLTASSSGTGGTGWRSCSTRDKIMVI